MKGRVCVVAGPDVTAGFALAGLDTVVVPPEADAGTVVGGVVSEPGVGVVLVEERVFAALPGAVREQFGRRPLPLVVPFPGPVWRSRRAEAEMYIVDLLRRAIGYRVKLV